MTVDRDLFGNPITPKAQWRKKKQSIPPPPPPPPRPQSRRPSFLWRLTTDLARETLVTLLAAVILAWAAQVRYDWLGWTKAEIGEWKTTTRKLN